MSATILCRLHGRAELLLRPPLSAAGVGTVIYAGPFVPTVPNTDKCLDEL
jgi:hypothetical protein